MTAAPATPAGLRRRLVALAALIALVEDAAAVSVTAGDGPESSSHAKRLMRVHPQEQAAMEISSSGSFAALEGRDEDDDGELEEIIVDGDALDGDEEVRRDYFQCAVHNENCTCQDGVVLLGAKGKIHWASLRVQGTVNCSTSVFSDPEPGSPKVCRCYSLAWCEGSVLGKQHLSNGFKTDKAHRRRHPFGRTKGVGMYQRRRWCGFGAQECRWSTWTDWGYCSHNCGQEGTQTRQRVLERDAGNSGRCVTTSNATEVKACNTGPCTPADPNRMTISAPTNMTSNGTAVTAAVTPGQTAIPALTR